MYLFLDFDGVLCTSGTYKRWEKAGGKFLDDPSEYDEGLLALLFDAQCCSHVQQLCAMINAEIVLTTSWREEHNHALLCRLLQQAGITAPVIGQTPVLKPYVAGGWGHVHTPTRGEEIERWLVQRERDLGVSIPKSEIIVLEDEENVAPYRGRQVKTSFYGTRAGFQQKHLNVGLRLAGWKVCRDPASKRWTYTPPQGGRND